MNQYKCTSINCSHVTNEIDNILEHVNITHTNEPVFNFKCMSRLPAKCHRKFLTFDGLEKHMRQFHPEKVDLISIKPIKCDLCELTPSNVKELQMHYIDHWVYEKEPIKCIFSNCIYETNREETNHKKVKNNWSSHCSKYHPPPDF